MYRQKGIRIFYIWRDKFLRYQQLNQEDRKLEEYQKDTLRKKIWESLKKNTHDSKWKRAANLAAQQERQYWLTKRAIIGWKDQTGKLSQKTSLYKLLRTHNNFSLQKRTFIKFKQAIMYKQEQRYNDLVAINEIVKLRQRNVLKKWHLAKTKQTAAKLLTYH